MSWEISEGELAGRWSIRFDELELLKTKPLRTWLGFMTQLKVFQSRGWFPEDTAATPEIVVSYLAEQIEVRSFDLSGYDWSGRTGRRHRAEILNFLAHRRMRADDRRELSDWLRDALCPLGGSTNEMVERA